MTSLCFFQYGNPEDSVIRRQEESAKKEQACGKCRERISLHWHGEEIVNCGIKYQQYGRRCEHFYKRPQNDTNT